MEVAWQGNAAHAEGQLKNAIGNGQSTSGMGLPKWTDSPPALHAEKGTILGICIADILRLGGTWPPGGTKTTAVHNARRATSTIKDVNSCSEEDLMRKSRERLRAYLHCRKHRPPSPPTLFLDWPPNSKSRTPVWSVTLTCVLSEADVARVNELRPKRLMALVEGKRAAFRAYSNELHALTGKHGYTA